MSVTAKLPPPGDPRSLYVIDISGYVFRPYHPLPPLQSAAYDAHTVRLRDEVVALWDGLHAERTGTRVAARAETA